MSTTGCPCAATPTPSTLSHAPLPSAAPALTSSTHPKISIHRVQRRPASGLPAAPSRARRQPIGSPAPGHRSRKGVKLLGSNKNSVPPGTFSQLGLNICGLKTLRELFFFFPLQPPGSSSAMLLLPRLFEKQGLSHCSGQQNPCILVVTPPALRLHFLHFDYIPTQEPVKVISSC